MLLKYLKLETNQTLVDFSLHKTEFCVRSIAFLRSSCSLSYGSMWSTAAMEIDGNSNPTFSP